MTESANDNGGGKVCTKCGEWKPLVEFSQKKGCRDGLSPTCKDCAKAASKAWRAANPERAKAVSAAYRASIKPPDLTAKQEARAEAAKNGMKICPKCGETKLLVHFGKAKDKRDGHASWCKECVKPITKAWNEANPDRVKANSRAQYARDPAKRRAAHEKWKAANPEKMREAKRRCRSTPKGRVEANVRGAIHKRIKKGWKFQKTFDALGYSSEELMKTIQSQFLPGMTWENYGPVWHIDHIVPNSLFNYASTEDLDFRRAWALSNLQPLWASDNMSKHAKYDGHFQSSLAFGAPANDNTSVRKAA